jgi:hypothetical protein
MVEETRTSDQTQESFPEQGSVINLKHFMMSWDQEAVNLSIKDPDAKDLPRIAEKMNVTTDLVEELSSVCGYDFDYDRNY